MTHAIVAHEFGGPEVLQWEQVAVADPRAGEIRVRHEAIGLNFIDVYHRTGLYPNPLPLIPGSEAAGVVTAVGEGVTEFSPGDRIAYYGPVGAYSEERILPARRALPLAAELPMEVAAAVTLKGMTACYLLTMTHRVKANETLLIHAAAGGVGQLLVQWALHLGARVISLVSGAEKAQVVRELGADHIIDVSQEDFVERVRDITAGRGVDVVYDSVGKDTFEKSLDCLRPRGLMVSFGNASGPVAIANLGVLASKGSLFVTRPTLTHYFADREIELASASQMYELVNQGVLRVHIGQRLPLRDAAHAHRALEARQTLGSTLLVP